MSFFELSDGSKADGSGGKFDQGRPEPLPDKTTVLCMCDEVKWEEHEGSRHISLKWTVLQPASYSGRVIFQKLRVYDNDTKKADKAKRMLAAIDANAKGALAKSSLEGMETEPTDIDLTRALIQRTMFLKVGLWDFDGKTGNWVMAVSPGKLTSASTAKPAKSAKPAKPVEKRENTHIPEGFDDDIPF